MHLALVNVEFISNLAPDSTLQNQGALKSIVDINYYSNFIFPLCLSDIAFNTF